jgi:hypothetical protein
MSAARSHLSASYITHQGQPVTALTPLGTTHHAWPPRSRALMSISGAVRVSPSRNASDSASPRRSHPAASRRPASCITPLPVAGAEHCCHCFPIDEALKKPLSCELMLSACFLRRRTLPCLTLSILSMQGHRRQVPRTIEAEHC